MTWNSARFVRDCLGSIPVAFRVDTVVVDNGSCDGTAAVVRAEFPDVSLKVNAANVGYARASNQGLAAALAGAPDFVLLLNPDTRLPPDGIERMLDYARSHPEVGVVAPKLVNPDGSPQHSVRRFPTYRRMFAALLGRSAEYKLPDFDFGRVQEVEQPMASCLLIRRGVLGQAGRFDEQFVMFMNDVDLLRRIADAGWKIIYYPEVAVWHYRGGSTEQARSAMILSMHASLFRYFRKHDRSGWFWLKAVPLALAIEAAALVRIVAGFRRCRR